MNEMNGVHVQILFIAQRCQFELKPFSVIHSTKSHTLKRHCN